MLSHNVRVISEGVETDKYDRKDPYSGVWPCTIYVADFNDFSDDSDDVVARKGKLKMDNTEVWGCGQVDSFRAGIRFHKLSGQKKQIVTNSSVRASRTINIYAEETANIFVHRNFMAMGVRNNLWVKKLSNINNVFTENLGVYAIIRPASEHDARFEEYCNFWMCARTEDSPCSFTFQKNIGAGAG